MSEHDNKHLNQPEGTGELAGNRAVQSNISEISNLSEFSPAESILSELEIEPDEDYERGREKRAKRHKAMNKICGISCTVFGTVGTIAIGACTAMACMLYGPRIGSGHAAQPDRFVPVQPVSSSDSRIPSSSDGHRPSESSYSKPESGSSARPQQSSVSRPSGNGGSSHIGSQGRPSDNTSHSHAYPSSSTPVALPDTGENMAGRVPVATEVELLRAQSRRIARGESPYSNTDIKISVAGELDISDISDIYGFSPDFIRKYNAYGHADEIINIPRL